MRVKLFVGGVGFADDLTERVNGWLAKNEGVDIKNITSQAFHGDIVICITYESRATR